jgi:NTP pyrophosphatase (non-canonical NTP hydrolase)
VAEPALTLRALQAHIRAKDHDPTRRLEYLQKLVEEVGELARAMRHGARHAETRQIRGTVDEELYDVLYYVAAVANLYDIDLETAMRLKEPLNAARYGPAPTARDRG